MSSKWSGWHVQCPSVPCLICPEWRIFSKGFKHS
jgi:hypothetical protein